MKTRKVIRFSFAILIGIALIGFSIFDHEQYPMPRSKLMMAGTGTVIVAMGVLKLCAAPRARSVPQTETTDGADSRREETPDAPKEEK